MPSSPGNGYLDFVGLNRILRFQELREKNGTSTAAGFFSKMAFRGHKIVVEDTVVLALPELLYLPYGWMESSGVFERWWCIVSVPRIS